MITVYAGEKPPQTVTKSIFLAGPTPRDKKAVPSWRPEALKLLEEEGYDGVVFIPEHREGVFKSEYIDQIDWEEIGLHMSDCVLFWVPRKMDTMPALTTNVEWGKWEDTGKVVFGAPEEAVHVRYLEYYVNQFNVPKAKTLRDTVKLAIAAVGAGAERTDGEREVPLHIWKTPTFQQWYQNQKKAGNRLDGARVCWTFRVGPQKSFVFLWILHVNIFVGSENRNMTNEFVLARPDISTVVMYNRGHFLKHTEIVLVREFRSPSASSDGFVWEIPGGSSFKPGKSILEIASAECEEETGLSIEARRFKFHKTRQLVATLSAHKAHVLSVEITDEELEYLKGKKGVPYGVVEDSERTYVEVMSVHDILQDDKVDWSTVGMILSVMEEQELFKQF